MVVSGLHFGVFFATKTLRHKEAQSVRDYFHQHKFMFQYFLPCKKSDIAARVRVRSGETKLGELIKVPEDTPLLSFLKETSARFVVLGDC